MLENVDFAYGLISYDTSVSLVLEVIVAETSMFTYIYYDKNIRNQQKKQQYE